MTANGFLQIALYFMIALALAIPLGHYIAWVYEKKSCGLDWILSPIEKTIYRLCGINAEHDMSWQQYAMALLVFNVLGILICYAIFRLQAYLPFNPQQWSAVDPAIALNTAISFVTNTNWQAYSGETTMSYASDTLALTVQNFLSAATGMSVVMTLIRGLTRQAKKTVGNFWVDTVRGTLYILLPLSLLLAIVLSSTGLMQNFKPYQKISLLQPITYQNKIIHEQIIPMGPVASQIAIKQLGTNGGGFFNTNSAHPLENPTSLTNFFEMLAIVLIPMALCFTFGNRVRDKRQGHAILITMMSLLIPLVFITAFVEQKGTPVINALPIAHTSLLSTGGNMEGKETRFGIINSAVWATVTTATANGSVNAMLDSFTPLGGMVPLWLMHLGEVVLGGVGSGLYGMLMLVILTVFLAGLMVGRTPEYLGKKIEPFEMKMVAVAILIMPVIVLIMTGIAILLPTTSVNSGAHQFTEILYAFTSLMNNNGSAFSGLDTTNYFYTMSGSIVMFLGRYWTIIPILAIAGSLAQKKSAPISAGTLATHTPLFIILLISVVIVLGALTFFPALALGPIVEHFLLWNSDGH